MKYISPGGWFSLEYPDTWSEFEDMEESFLFYNPNKWNGNFRISAYKDKASDYASQCIDDELKNNPNSTIVKIGEWKCAYCAEDFQEENNRYTTHFWVTGKGNICIECSFTVFKGDSPAYAEEIIRSLKLRKGTEEKEIIPIRVLEIGEVNAAFEWASTTVKKTLTKDFTSQEADIEKLQKLIDGGKLKTDQRNVWENIGLAFGTILENEMDGMNWVTIVDKQKEYPALQFADSSLVIEPTTLVWNKIRQKQPCDLKAEFQLIKAKVETWLNKE
ncbi:MAG: DUF3805 domain-containing protein [Bacteroidaceae bacterium]|nr:DUF3805 domain-containing protein [Bacteroidaceae bacterium]